MLLEGLRYAPQAVITDTLKPCAAAKRETGSGSEHRQSRYLNNRCEVPHQPTGRRERHRKRFKSARQARQFLSSHSPIHDHFQLRRHLISASVHRASRARPSPLGAG
ncbi:DDE-type integrase/transposase/recombinase [Azospirillum sp. A29]|uniref:DDE-type integrase/transposase/recombinase n=1 Tax=Azospirillum sp. A29 TaxID=3160606 RepID=UPI00366AB068